MLGHALLNLLPLGFQDWFARRALRSRNVHWLDDAWFERQGVPLRMPTSAGALRNLRPALLETITTTSLPMLLRYEDRNSMAFGIESRVPFLTPQLAQFVLSLPDAYLLGDDGMTKSVLRAAMDGIAPQPILQHRDKIGFQTPESSWLHSLRPWVERTLQSEMARTIPAWHYNLMLDHSRQGFADNWMVVSACGGR